MDIGPELGLEADPFHSRIPTPCLYLRQRHGCKVEPVVAGVGWRVGGDAGKVQVGEPAGAVGVESSDRVRAKKI